MKKACFYVLVFLASVASSFGQSRTYIEVAGGGKFRFHYNEQYFLVDKNCEFLSRIRISAMNAEKQFTGDFTDYNIDGAILLTGSYQDGKRNGTFKAFYPNGFLRWQGDFDNNIPKGVWNYYYPDGKPKTIIDFKNEKTYILESWNEKGKQVVRDGEGTFFLKDFQFGYNNIGHEALSYRGKLKSGLPHGYWRIEYVFPDGNTEPFTSVAFKEGVTPANGAVQFAESETFGNAENFLGKNCTIDDQSNFAEYLRNNLNLKFDFGSLTGPELSSRVEATVKVSSSGDLMNVWIKTSLGKAADTSLIRLLESIDYWIPSQKDGKTIDDELSITLKILLDENQNLSFGYPQIKRMSGG